MTALTFEAQVTGIESNKCGLSHVAGKVLRKGFWVGGRERKHLFVHGQRGEDPAEGEIGEFQHACKNVFISSSVEG